MKIKELILEGFKSYQKQVILTEFDPQFNCLTGQNGTGKSNILEAIFFAIGFNFRNSKLSRVSNPRDLIYKRGQSNVQKAKVIVKFCNRDKAKSPVGYEDKDELIVERSISSIDNKGKFKLNSVTKKQSQIKAIFKSIRLNVDNSNTFFVQQGKVAEIVKFNPLELMKFVEESAGVSYFNSVKQETEDSIKKNDPKLQSCIEGVQQLEKDQIKNNEQIEVYKQYKKIEEKLKELQLKEEYYKRKQGKNDLIRNSKDIENLQQQEQQLKKQIKQNEFILQQKQEQLQKFQLDEKNQSNQNLKENLQQKKQEQDDNKKELDDLQFKIDNLENLQKKQKQDNKKKKIFKEEKQNLLETLQEKFENLNLLIQKNQLEKKDLEIYINEKNNTANQIEFIRKKYEVSKQEYLKIQESIRDIKYKIDNNKKRINELQDNITKNNDQYEKYKNSHEKYLQQEKNLQAQYDLIITKRKELQDIKQQKILLNKEQGQLETRIQDQLGGFIRFYEVFNYQQIINKFGKQNFFRKVHNIINVKDPIKFNKAIETIAGKKLFNYVTSNENISTELMNSNQLRGDIQIIPNNKITGRSISIEQITLAKQVAKKMNKQVWTPQELIEYPENLQNTINYVFQNVLICSDQQIAIEVCFNIKELKLDCITLTGDTYSPSGQLSGGYNKSKVSFLEYSQLYKEFLKKYEDKEKKILRCEQQLSQYNSLYEEEKTMKYKLHKNGQKLDDLQNKIDQLKLESLKNQICMKQTQIKHLEEECQKQQQNLLQQKNLKQNYQKQMQNSKSKINQEFFLNRLQEINDILQEKQNDKIEIEKKIKETQMSLNSLKDFSNEQQLKLLQDNNDVLKIKRQQLEILKQKQTMLQKQIEQINNEIFQQQNQQNFIEQRENDLINEKQKLIQQIENNKQQLITCKDDLNEKKKYQKQLEQTYNNRNQRKIEQKEMQIEQDFSNNDENETTQLVAEKLLQIKNNIVQSKKEYEDLKKKINVDIEEIFNKVDERLKDFKDKQLETVRNKKNLIESIEILTKKSYETVNRCFEEVNEHLGKIFSVFLPGLFAKMEMIDVFNKKLNKDQKGITIKVKIGQKWKESLGELSGGQRTLLALSFLLSLLKYNSAPFYIFDEVDAALDQSNTENLGLIISKYFSQSQFFIISLSENFYKNANVLFRTSQINGYSAVERINLKDKKIRNKKKNIRNKQLICFKYLIIQKYWQIIALFIFQHFIFPLNSKVAYTFY